MGGGSAATSGKKRYFPRSPGDCTASRSRPCRRRPVPATSACTPRRTPRSGWTPSRSGSGTTGSRPRPRPPRSGSTSRAGCGRGPTATAGSHTGQLATTAYVQNAVTAATAGVASFNTRTGAVTLTNADVTGAGGAPLLSPIFTGNPQAPTAVLHNSSTSIATTAYVQGELAALPTSPVTSFNGRTGAITLTTADITGAGGAPLASPALSGTPSAPTAAGGTNTTQLATTGFVQNAITALGTTVQSFNGRTGAVSLLGNDISAAGGALLAGPAFTGAPTAPTATVGTASTQLATTAFVQNAITALSAGVTSFNTRSGAVTLLGTDITGAGGALLASPAFTGTPTAPTAVQTSNDTTVATTAYVRAALAAATGGVSSFNTRTGAITLVGADVSAAGGALSASPTFTGTPAAPTAAPGTSSTQLATTAFVAAALATAGGVTSFNSRAGAVTLASTDISGASGVVYNASQTLTDPQRAQARANIYAAPFDALAFNGMQMNGSMEVSQVSGTLAFTGSGYVLDGWSVAATGPAISAQQVTDAPPGYANSLKVTVTTADAAPAAGDFLQIYTSVEGFRVERLAMGTASASPLSFGIWLKANRPGTYSYTLRNGGANRSYNGTLTISASGTWQFVTGTIPGDIAGTWQMANLVGLYFGISLMTGSAYQTAAGVWTAGNFTGATGAINGAAATTDYMQVTGVILVPGIELPAASRAPFIMRPFDQELLLAKRYYTSSYLPGILPGTAAAAGYVSMFAASATQLFGNIPFPVELRSNPNLQLWSYNGLPNRWSNTAGVDQAAAASLNQSGTRIINSGGNSTPLAAGAVYLFHYTADARL